MFKTALWVHVALCSLLFVVSLSASAEDAKGSLTLPADQPIAVWKSETPWFNVTENGTADECAMIFATANAMDGRAIEVPSTGFWGARIAGKHSPDALKVMFAVIGEKNIPGLWLDWHYDIQMEEELAKLRGLKFLVLSCFSPLNDKTFWRISALNGLETFELFDWYPASDQNPEYDLTRVRDIQGLKRLAFSSPRLTDDNVGFLSPMKGLTHIRFESPRLTESSLRKITVFPNTLSFCLKASLSALDESIIAFLSRVPEFDVMSYKNPGILGQAEVEEICTTANPSSVVLYSFSDKTASAVCARTSIRKLSVSAESVSADAFAQMKTLENLGSVEVSGLRLADSGLKGLAGVTTLRRVVLKPKTISVTADAAETFATLPELTEFEFTSETKGGAEVIKALAAAPKLKVLKYCAPDAADVISMLSAFPALEEVHIGAPSALALSIAGLAGVKGLRKLVVINADKMTSEQVVSALSSVTTLEHAAFLNCGIAASDVASLKGGTLKSVFVK